MNTELIDVLDKIADTITVVSGNLLCPSYHGLVKYNHVNNKIRELRETLKVLRENVK